MGIKTIFLDLDGVLVDFWSGAVRAHGREPEHVTAEERANWALPSWLCDGNYSKFWGRISELGKEFWAQLEPYPWMLDLWNGCKDIAPTCLLTSPARGWACPAGKVEWIANHLKTRDFFLGANKAFVAGPGKYLVDDYSKNLYRFQEAGGTSIRFKAPWDPSSEGLSWDEVLTFFRSEVA